MGVFDKWYEGTEDATSAEVVICLDLSGSMAGVIAECSRSLWILKSAFEKCEIRTTVLGFSDTHSVLFQPNEKAGSSVRMFMASGGTDPTESVRQAFNILMGSQATNKFFIAITD